MAGSVWLRFSDGVREVFKEPDLNKARAFYFCFHAAMGALTPYLSLFYKHTLLLSPQQAGALLAVRPACLLFASPIWGTMADKLNRFRVILLVSLCAYVVCYGSVAAVVHVQGLDCHSLAALNQTSAGNHSSRTDPLPNHYTNVLMWKLFDSWPYKMHEYKNTEGYTQSLFISLLIITIIGELVASPAATFADLYLLQTLADKTTLFGQQLIPGVIGWGISRSAMFLFAGDSLMASHSYCKHGQFSPSAWFLLIFCLLMACCIVIAWGFHFRRYETDPSTSTSHGWLRCKFPHAVARLVKQPSHAVFIVVVALFGVGEGIRQLYLYNYLSDIGGGLTIFLTVTYVHLISQIAFLYFSPRIINRFSPEALIYAGLLGYGVTFIFYALIENPWFVVVVEPVSGFFSKVLFVLAVTYVGSPPQVGAALQGLVHGIYTGLGVTLGGLIGVGTVLRFGYFSVFIAVGCGFLLFLLLVAGVHHLYPAVTTIAGAYDGYRKLDFNEDDDSELDDIDEQELRELNYNNVR